MHSGGGYHLAEYQRVKNGEDFFAVVYDALDGRLVPWVLHGEPLPALEHLWRHVNISAELLQRMTAQK